MHRPHLPRFVVVLIVLVAMSYVTWIVHRHYWRRGCYRPVAQPGTVPLLYVVNELDEDMFRRFRSRFGELCLIDLRPDDERDAPGNADQRPLVQQSDFALIRRIPIPRETVPTPRQVIQFLRVCAGADNRPAMLFAGTLPHGQSDLRADALEAAYRHLLLRQPVEDAVRSTPGLARATDTTGVRRLLRDVARTWNPADGRDASP